MIDREQLVARIVEASGGEIVGRIRLQKAIYLLDQLGLNSGFSFAYHHYGPFSSDLVDAVDGAKAFRFVSESSRPRLTDGVAFSVYSSGECSPAQTTDRIGSLPTADVVNYLDKLNARSATVLEIAATIHWLRSQLGLSQWREELVRRKGKKAENGRTDEALKLLEDLKLAA